MDRFQDTKKLLHDYYRAMEGKIPTDTSSDFTRIPLKDLMERRASVEEGKMKMYVKNGRTALINRYVCIGAHVNRRKNTCMNILPLYMKHLLYKGVYVFDIKHLYVRPWKTRASQITQ